MSAQDLLFPIGIILAGGVGLLLLVVLPWMIASTRKAHHADRVRQLSLAGVVISTFGFLWALLGRSRPGLSALVIGIAPGALVWLIALIWACLGRPAQIIRGFEVGPVPPKQT